MRFLNKHKALIIAILTVSIFTAGLLSLQFSIKDNLSNQIIYNLDFEEVEELEKIFEDLRTPPEKYEIETHKAFNEAEKATASHQTSNSQKESGKKNEASNQRNIDEQILDELANQPDLIAVLDKKAKDIASNSSKTPVPKPQKEVSSKGDDSSNDIAFKNTVNRNSSMYYHLTGRIIIDFPNPIYTCEKSGKIVVNIIVDSAGKVIETSLNQASSTSSDWCLIENSLNYASKATFNPSENQTQSGTITYLFPGKGRN